MDFSKLTGNELIQAATQMAKEKTLPRLRKEQRIIELQINSIKDPSHPMYHQSYVNLFIMGELRDCAIGIKCFKEPMWFDSDDVPYRETTHFKNYVGGN